MREDNLEQPPGGILLKEVLGHAQYALRNTKYNSPLYYKMSMGYVGQHGAMPNMLGPVNKTALHQPSYNLVIYFGEIVVFVAHYELDSRFSLEMCEEERERVEDFLANESLGIISCYGVSYYIGARIGGRLMSITRKESDDKKFLPLN